MRVVSLLPAATEVLCALGVAPVGVSHECDHPPEIDGTPAVTRPRIDPNADAGTIDEQVARAADDGGVYDLDRDLLADLDPNLIVTQGVCEVCAVDRVHVETAASALDLDAEIVTVDVHSLADLYDAIESVGSAVDRQDSARDLIATLRDRVERVEETANRADRRPSVAVLDWTDPPMVAGHWMPELVEIAGGRYGLASTGDHSRPREWSELREYDPAVLLVAPCGFSLSQTRANLADLTDRPGWDDVEAVERGRTWLVDGHHYVNRPGPRLVETLEIVAGIVQPGLFDAPAGDVAERL